MSRMEVLQRFGGRLWSAPAFLPYVQPPLTDEVVEAAELQLGIRLSEVYVALLRQQNGGYLRGSHGVSSCIAGIGPKFPSITRDDAWWRPRRAKSGIWTPRDPTRLIPFDGDGHWDMCFDYRQGGGSREPSITFVSCESELEEPVSDTFEEYLAALEDSLASDVRLYGDVVASTVARRLAQELGGLEPTVDSFAHGFPQWRVELPGEAQWVWCSPNLVPAGFYRDGDDVVVTDACVLQIPEDPACQVLLSVTANSRERCMAALADLGLATESS